MLGFHMSPTKTIQNLDVLCKELKVGMEELC